MSIRVMSWVMDEAPVENTTEMVVLYVLADHARDDGTCAWPSHATIARKTRCSRRTVIRHIKALESRGLIARGDQRHVAHIPADRRSVVWNLNLEMRMEDKEEAGCQNGTSQGDGVPTSVQRGDNGGYDGVTTSAQRGDTGVTQPILNPSSNPSLNQESVADAPTSRKNQAHELPENWRPDPLVWEKMAQQRPDVDLELEHEKFCDHWPSQPGARSRKKDWNATWRNWIRNSRPVQRQSTASTNTLAAWGAPSAQPQPADDWGTGDPFANMRHIIDHQEET